MYQRDFFVVITGDCRFCVSTAMAAHIERALGAQWMPRWVTFVDLMGSRVRVRADRITMVMQSTADQRAAERMHLRWMMWEQESDRPPEAGA
ncbi:MAG: hypothetical protein ACJ8B6_04750 [Gemmatimonadales bacterium]|jgi:hypothetical protein